MADRSSREIAFVAALAARRLELKKQYGTYAFSRAAVARRVGVTAEAINCWEQGKYQPGSLARWQRWAEVLGMTITLTRES